MYDTASECLCVFPVINTAFASVYRESGSKTELPVMPFPVPNCDSMVEMESKLVLLFICEPK